jgi:teichuronic acid biosynthesis glycosyltransferase TuaG
MVWSNFQMPHSRSPVSAIIPAYRATQTIERALESIAQQTSQPKEIIVVDDGSNDGTYEAALSCAHLFSDLKFVVVQQENAGAGSARNRAIVEASQPYLAFLDADDEWLPEHIERSLSHIQTHGAVLVAHNEWIVEGGKEVLNDCAARFKLPGDPFMTLYKKGFLSTCTVVANREAVVTAGGFDISLPNVQDFELWLAVLSAPGTSFFVFDEALSRYHVLPDSIMSNIDRRFSCGMIVAQRFAIVMKNDGRGYIGALWYRLAAIHYETLQSFAIKNRYMSMLLLLLMLPFKGLWMTLKVRFSGPRIREDFIANIKLNRNEV